MSAETGWLYILSNASTQAYKVGVSTGDPNIRARQLSASSGVATPFAVVYSRFVAFPFKVEAAIHAALDDYRLNTTREFFAVPLRQIIELAEQYKELPERRVTVASNIDNHLPFSWLFASFRDDGEGRALDESERQMCRDLERRLHTGENVH